MCFVYLLCWKEIKAWREVKGREMGTAGEISLHADRRDRLFCLLSGAEARDLK